MTVRSFPGLSALWAYRASAQPMVRRYLASSGTLLIGVITQFTLFVILARALRVEQFGTFVVISAVTSLAASFCGVGAADAMVRRSARDLGEYGKLLGHGLILIAASGLCLAIVSTAVLALLVTASPSFVGNLFALANFSLAGIVLFAFISFAERVFIGRQDFLRANIVSGGFAVIRLLAGAVAWLGFGLHGLGQWALWNLVAHLVAAVAFGAMLYPLGRPIWRVDRRELRLGFHFSSPFFLDALRQNVDRISLSFVVPAAILGSYGAAIRLVQTSQIVVSSLNRIVYPQFARRAHLGLSGAINPAIAYLVAVLAAVSATAVGLFVAAPWLPTILGADYTPVVGYLRTLCWVVIPLGAQTVPYDVLGALDRHSIRAAVYNGVSAVGILFTALAIYGFGITGAYVAIYVTQIAVVVALWSAFLNVRDRAPGLESKVNSLLPLDGAP
jgi:O-antigen/teichoic acid export membrane protein